MRLEMLAGKLIVVSWEGYVGPLRTGFVSAPKSSKCLVIRYTDFTIAGKRSEAVVPV